MSQRVEQGLEIELQQENISSPEEVFAKFFGQFDDLDTVLKTNFINFVVLHSESESDLHRDDLEEQLYSYILEHLKNDERFEFISTEVSGQTLEFIVVKPLVGTTEFSTRIIPFIRKDPKQSYIGFHDTTNYFAEIISQNGIEDPDFTISGFYVHPLWLLREENWTPYFLDRLAYYGRLRNDPQANPNRESIKKTFPPKEIRETDSRSARIAIILPKASFIDRDSEKSVNFDSEANILYELRVSVAVPSECCVITNVYHQLQVLEEMLEKGLKPQQPEYDKELSSLRAQYDFYGFNHKTGKKD